MSYIQWRIDVLVEFVLIKTDFVDKKVLLIYSPVFFIY